MKIYKRLRLMNKYHKIDEAYEITKHYRRFDETLQLNIRSLSDLDWQSKWSSPQMADQIRQRNIDGRKEGYSQEDYAFSLGAGFVSHLMGGHSGTFVVNHAFAFEERPNGRRREYNKLSISQKIKRIAKFYGADIVGICENDIRWIYYPRFNPGGKEAILTEFPAGYNSVVVLGIEMDYGIIADSPSALSTGATELGYSRLVCLAASLCTFIRNLGYNAIPSVNETGLSIPFAIAAGLGEVGRNGLLITPQFGPRVRLCKIFTDLPLQDDQVITFGVRKFCKSCGKCVRACPAQAIPEDDPTYQGPSISNNPGVLKWYVNVDKCRHFWNINGSGCAICVRACTYNKRYNVIHRTVRGLAPKIPSLLVWFDNLLGYGKRVKPTNLV